MTHGKINLEIPLAQEPKQGWTVDPKYIRRVTALINEYLADYLPGMEETEAVIVALMNISDIEEAAACSPSDKT